MMPQVAALLMLCLWVPGWAAAREPVTGMHVDLACEDCHQDADGAGDPTDCDACHDPKTNIHPVHVVPTIPVPERFSLGKDGKLLCRSCHTLHGGDPGSKFLNAEAGHADRSAFCAQCHGAQMARANPHQARRGTERCAFCHASIPEPGSAIKVAARMDIVRLCDFCHDAVAKNHPRNIDPTLDLPAGLPLSPGGDWTCVTCHNPHGTTTTTHYVRPEFASHFERGRQANPHVDSYFACKACHTASVATEILPPDYALRYRGDINVLCISCHVTDRGHHPTGVPLPPMMEVDLAASGAKLQFDAEGRITCYTCHDNGCSTGHQTMQQRHYDRSQMQNDLCWNCHRRDEFSRVNPHVDDERMCAQCHESRPIPGISSGLMTVPKMVCLRCHDVKPHPANADHLREPTAKIKPDPALPLGPGGDVTCVTCHDPHAQAEPTAKRLRLGTLLGICNYCHWR